MKWFAFLFIGTLLVLAGFAPWLIPYDFQELDMVSRFTPPHWNHIFGQDEQGQDLFVKIIYGGRLSLLVTFSVLFFSCALGLLLGTVSGLAGGIVESLIMAFADFVLAFPKFLLALAFLALAGASVGNLIFVFDFFNLGGLCPLGSGRSPAP